MRSATGRITLAASCLCLVSPAAFAQADGSAVANVPEPFPEYMPGPNTGEPTLPTPPPPLPPPAPGEPTPANAGAVHFSLGLDFTNAYFSRGLRQEDNGLIVQPWATVGFDLVNSDEWSLQGFVGTWNSMHDKATGSTSTDDVVRKWYESDVYFGLNATVGDWSLGVQYGWFTSPNGAFTTVEELQFSAAYDDAAALGKFSLAPVVTLVIETGDGTSDGMAKGDYLQAAIEPGIDFEAVEGLRVSFPAMVGVSASKYYEHADGSDDFFGFASVGAKASCDLPVNDKYGCWKCYAAVNAIVLGDLAKEVNDDNGTALVVSVGMSVEY